MRAAGRIEPGRSGGALTGQPGFLSPVRIDATSEMLSLIVRDLGCVAICSRIAESGAAAREPLPVAGVDTLSRPARAAAEEGEGDGEGEGEDAERAVRLCGAAAESLAGSCRARGVEDAVEERSHAAASRLSAIAGMCRRFMSRRLYNGCTRSRRLQSRSAMRPLQPGARRVGGGHVDDAALAKAYDLTTGRNLHAVDQFPFGADDVVDRAGDRASARRARANPQVAVEIRASGIRRECRPIVGQFARADEGDGRHAAIVASANSA